MSKRFTHSWLRRLALGAVGMMALGAWGASITVDGINYTTSVDRTTHENVATVARYTINKTTHDTTWYAGDIVIPEFVTYNNVDYKVTATAANAFLDCKNLTSLVLPETCTNIGRSCFKNCTALTVSPIPNTANTIGTGALAGCTGLVEFTIPAAWNGPMVGDDLAGMSNLKRLIFPESPNTFIMNFDAYGKAAADRVADKSIEEIIIMRNVAARESDPNNQQPFHNLTGLKTLTLGGQFTSITATMFQGCSALEQVVFADGNLVSAIGNNAFKACSSLQSFTYPDAVTTVEANVFNGCSALSNVVFGNATTSIGDGAFQGCSSLTAIALPNTVASIGAQAFQSTGLTGELTLNDGLQSIGSQAFASSKLTGINIPASVTSIGNAAFAPITTLAAITVADGSESFKVENGLLTNLAGTRLLVTAHKGDIGTALDNATIQTIDNYGLAYSPFTTINLPALTSVGNYGFANSKVVEFVLKSNVAAGYNLFNKAAIETLVFEDGRNEIPQAVANGCTKLTDLTLPATATNIMMNAFNGCMALKNMEIPSNVNYMEPGAVPATIESLRVLNVNTPVLAAGVFNASQGNVECKVAATAVDAYRAASQWNYLNIVGDATISGTSAAFGCPSGLYFATKDGKLMYKDENGDIIDTEFATGAHAFNLDSYKNRIYVGVAGQNFRYQDANAQANGGDGEVFYVNNTDGIFYRVTVLNNVGYKAFEDPFSLSIGADEGKIYIADRNVGVHEMSADTVGLYGSQPFLVQNNWLSYYPNGTAGWMYGGIGCGFYKIGDTYWMGKKFNGFGIFRFRKSDFTPDVASTGGEDPFKSILPYVQMTQFYVDQANGYIYFYLQSSKAAGRNDVPGVYRLPMSAVAENDAQWLDTDMTQAVLIDDSPVLKEGDGDEITGVTQFYSDGDHVYWSYIASPSDDKSVPNCVAVDVSNPLHHSGIKCVTAKPADPTEASPVQFAVEGVEAYGLVGSTYVPDVPEPQYKTGDVNGDGNVDIDDVNIIINIMLDRDLASNYGSRAYVNDDDKVDVSDLNELINILLSN
ncbi:MAG: leucine-rich repeat domain-containing protein [Muribaculaceae bacterium]|nr:leucine-rich repeat domain-containing protein [Muribaculaceae bacterium]